MRIVHFLWGLPNGGAENLAIDLANEQSRTHEVTLLVANALVDDLARARVAPNVRYICLGRPEGSRNPYWLARIIFTLRKLRPNIVHSHDSKLSKLARHIPAPMVLTVHTTGIELPPSAARFSVVCCISASVLQDVKQRYPLLNGRQVNNGIATAKIAVRKHCDTSTVRCVQVSRLVHETKGQDLLIKAVTNVNANSIYPALTVDFVGDGPSREYLEQLAHEAGVAKYCKFLGAMSRDDVYQTLCNYDILVQPSRVEGFGLTVAEGMAAGLMVIVSNVAGPMEVIGEGRFGHFFKSNDIDSLTVVLQNLVSSYRSPEALERLIAARRHVVETYDLSQTSKHYGEIYQEVIDG